MTDPGLLNSLLDSSRPIVIDGALATELEVRGHDLNSKLWSASILRSAPEDIRAVHVEYYISGAQVATTASYQASFAGLLEEGYDEVRARELVVLSVRLAQEARSIAQQQEQNQNKAPRPLLVAGSVGPYGAYLSNGAEYTGDYSLSIPEFQDFHRSRITALLDAGVDLLALETLPSFTEIDALLQMLETEFPAVRAWVGITVRKQGELVSLADGTPLSRVAERVNSSATVVAVGLNCVAQELVSPALVQLRQGTSKDLLCYPNSGETWDATAKVWRGSSSGREGFEKLLNDWRAIGARWLGGCCRMGPDDIKVIREVVDTSS
ncbi:homocysteine S-methyltransferase [Saccharata proteae CBS 121410]|uniref:Homocysteine S-methyltransferase n=1 Tax=Saccharata proteae CBS 121410 TaxID=1314787 RepID=A0A9P4HYN8_9PEZI|nr:homocysteine S-methyltransferase [Saccharata proteae CBS 121410]